MKWIVFFAVYAVFVAAMIVWCVKAPFEEEEE